MERGHDSTDTRASWSWLWPRPKSVALGPRTRRWDGRVRALATVPVFARESFELLHARASSAPRVEDGARELELAFEVDSRTAEQGYGLAIEDGGACLRARVRCATAAGARHALATLEQLRQLGRTASGAIELPLGAVDDEPDLAVRGVMLDVSRTRVPTLETLFDFVERLAALKLNQLQLYTEHTFAYRGHEEVWRDSGAYGAGELRALDAFCRARGVELVPNQQSFGHMHRWLVLDRYRSLAEVPEGLEHAFSIHKEPFALCPIDPRSLALLEDLYAQLLPCFESRQFNVGLDETFDLGLGRSRAACEARGRGRVYLEFLREVHARVAAHGRRMQFWGDIIVAHPELVPELPADVIALEWGYDAGHPFAEHARLFAQSGREFLVCPGTSSWQSIGGRTENMLANVRGAAREGARHGARGLLVTDWGDRGHLQPWCVSWPGFVLAAGASWNVAAADERELDLGGLLDRHVFDDEARVLGDALLDLGRCGDVSRARSTNGTALFFLLAFAPQGHPHARIEGLEHAGLLDVLAHLDGLRARIARARPRCADAALVRQEFEYACGLIACGARLGRARLDGGGTPERRMEIVAGLSESIARHGATWSARHRPGGESESRAWLERASQAVRDL